MKANKFLTLFGIFAIMLCITSCVEDDDFNLPNITVQAPDLSGFGQKTNFSAVVSRYLDAVADGDQVGIFTEDESDLYIEGYVVSSDQAGNFFEELVIQNSIDGNDPDGDIRRGLLVEINTRGLGDIYEVGRKIYIKLNGLAVEESHGVYTLGRAIGNSLDQIQEFEFIYDAAKPFPTFIARDPEVAVITPKMIAIADLSEEDENTVIQLNNMQFHRNNIMLTYAGEPTDSFDGFRTLESCDDGGSITLQSSTFADFKSVQLPQLTGSIQGVYTRDFGDDFSVLVINTTADIIFDNPERCDPNVLECDGPTGGSMTLFEQNFEGVNNLGDLEALGWENITVAGNEDFVIGNFSGNNYAQISGFNSGENQMETWLVTPDINLDASTNESFTFDLQVAFANGVILSVLITEDYTGDVTTTEWTEVDVNVPNAPTGGFGSFENMGDINISCLSGNVRIAFVYTGSDPSATTRYHIDNVEVTGN